MFDEKGFVSGTTLRGRTTCEILNLNRTDLVTLRKAAAEETLEGLLALGSQPLSPDHFGIAKPFSLMRRQILMRSRSPTTPSANPKAARRAQVDYEKGHRASSVADANRDLVAPTPDHPPPIEPTYSRLSNLFDPFSPLGDATHWLLSLSKLQFERAGRTLKSLLDLPVESVFRVEKSRVLLDDGDQAWRTRAANSTICSSHAEMRSTLKRCAGSENCTQLKPRFAVSQPTSEDVSGRSRRVHYSMRSRSGCARHWVRCRRKAIPLKPSITH